MVLPSREERVHLNRYWLWRMLPVSAKNLTVREEARGDSQKTASKITFQTVSMNFVKSRVCNALPQDLPRCVGAGASLDPTRTASIQQTLCHVSFILN